MLVNTKSNFHIEYHILKKIKEHSLNFVSVGINNTLGVYYYSDLTLKFRNRYILQICIREVLTGWRTR